MLVHKCIQKIWLSGIWKKLYSENVIDKSVCFVSKIWPRIPKTVRKSNSQAVNCGGGLVLGSPEEESVGPSCVSELLQLQQEQSTHHKVFIFHYLFLYIGLSFNSVKLLLLSSYLRRGICVDPCSSILGCFIQSCLCIVFFLHTLTTSFFLLKTNLKAKLHSLGF